MRHLKLVVSLVPRKTQFKVGLLIFIGILTLRLIILAPQPPLIVLATLGLFLMAFGYIGWCFWPKAQFFVQNSHLSGDPRLGLHLTFDDGPSEKTTRELLAVLRKKQIKVSFFILVGKAQKHPELLREMVRDGHTIGLHGFDHRLPFFRSKSALLKSLGDAKRELERLSGVPVTLFRPSHGFKNVALVRAVRQLGLNFCFWDAGVWDTDNPSIEILLGRIEAVKSIARAYPSRPMTLLMHDGLGDLQAEPPHATVLLNCVERLLS